MKRPHQDGIRVEAGRTALTRREVIGGGLAAAGSLALAGNALAGQAAGLAEAWRRHFRIGVAMSNQMLDRDGGPDLDIIARDFNSVTAENAMKWGEIQPDGVNWRWQRADQLVNFAAKHNMHVLGHTLVWHSQVPRSLFTGADGAPLARAGLLGRMEEHINAMVGRYKGRVHTWDVVNEAIDEGKGWRTSQWQRIIGDDYMEQAFRMARKADPAARLLYNDYNMHNPAKREFLVKVLRDYLDRGVPIDGIGLQGHLGLTYPDMEEWERSIATYAGMGLEVHVTELDVDVLPGPNTGAEISNRGTYSAELDPYKAGLPDEVQEKLADRYEQIFRILLRYRERVERVTFWGLHDGMSWKNGFPIAGRTNYPLLFDREMKPKPAYHRLMRLAQAQA